MRTVNEFARSLAQDIAKHYPPAIANNPAQAVSQKRLEGILEQVFAHAAEFRRENRLGWFKKTKLGMEFRWELKEIGYDEEFVARANERLMARLIRGVGPNA